MKLLKGGIENSPLLARYKLQKETAARLHFRVQPRFLITKFRETY